MPYDKLTKEEEQLLKEIVDIITPALSEMIHTKDSGEIKIFFHEGQFKRAKKEVTI
ncbi:MAG: hypothetical protein WC822_05805 [Candidatus Paceibacterota bacterium]|jgi:hypothetical protein